MFPSPGMVPLMWFFFFFKATCTGLQDLALIKGSGGNWLETAPPNCHLMKIFAVWRVSNSSWARTELYICAIPVFTIRWRSESTCPTDTIKQGRSYGNITRLFLRLKISIRTILLRSSGSASWTKCSLANDLCQWKCSLRLQLILHLFIYLF